MLFRSLSLGLTFTLFFSTFGEACVDLPKLLRNYRNLHGPEPRLEKILSLRVLGYVYPNEKDPALRYRFVSLKKAVNKSRISIYYKTDYQTQAYNGSSWWLKRNESTPAQPLPFSQGYALKRDAPLFNHLFFQKKSGAVYSFLRTQEIDGQHYIVVLVTLPTGAQIEYFINQKSLHEDWLVFRKHPGSDSKEHRIKCNNFVRIGEIILAKDLTVYDHEGKFLHRIEIVNCDWNCSILDLLFEAS